MSEKPFYPPPEIWMKLLKWFCDKRFMEEIEGDLTEWFNDEVEQYGLNYARRAFFWQLPAYLRRYFFRKPSYSYPRNHLAMIKNYVKIVGRSFWKHKWYASLNLLGLSVGFAAFILIQIYIHYETNFENFHSKAERIYRPTFFNQRGENFSVHWARIPFPYINELPDEIPEIETLIRFQNQNRKYIRIGQERFKPKHPYITDKEVFEVFDFNLTAGDPSTALVQPFSVVLTESMAQKYFGKENPIGKTIAVIDDLSPEEVAYQITGIMKDLPPNTHLPVDLLFSFEKEEYRQGWAYVYTLLKEGASIQTVTAKIPEFIANHTQVPEGMVFNIEFQPLSDIHLQSDLAREVVPNGNALYVRIFGIAALFILGIALINFINLNSALSIGRAREFGLRKVLGAQKWHNYIYAFVEAISYNLLALIIGGALAYFIFPYFQQFTGAAMLLSIIPFVGYLVLIALLGGVLAGLYPAFLINALNLTAALKTSYNLKLSRGRIATKPLLLGLQFTCAIILIGGAIIGHRQLQYIQNKELGFKKEQILTLSDVPDPATSKYKDFKHRVNEITGVKNVAACMQTPSEEIRDAGPVLVKGTNLGDALAPTMDMQIIDADFIDMMDIELLEGQVPTHEFVLKAAPTFSPEYSMVQYINEQPRSYLINETAMEQLGWSSPEEAIGREINWSIGGFTLDYGPITGVVKNFHQESLKNKIDPLLIAFEPIWLRSFLVEVETKDLSQTVAAVNKAWEETFPNYPFEYSFLDDKFNNLYQSERRQIELLSWFSLLSIFIAGIGLFSLVAYNLRTRLKELAIRKVLGAEVMALIRLVNKDYTWIVLVSGVLAIPICYLGVQTWLRNFAYTSNISPFFYLLPVIITLAVLLIIISLQTLYNSWINPADHLKQE